MSNYAFNIGDSSLVSVTFASGSRLQSIGIGAFQYSGLTSIAIPASVTTIGDNAFYSTSSLASVTFGSGSLLQSIGSQAFQSTGLTSIDIPASVTSIGTQAFRGTSSDHSTRRVSGQHRTH